MNAAVSLLVLGLIGAERIDAAAPPMPPVAPGASCVEEIWRLTLRDAIRIGLDNCEAVRVVSLGGAADPDRSACCTAGGRDAAIAIAPIAAGTDASPWRFKAEIMAHVRSVEQLYWGLVQQHAQFAAVERAVALADEIKRREESALENGRGTVADVAEATQRLEQFRLDLVTKTSDVITTERQLRRVLGLPPADSRRIVPVTAPVSARVKPDWDECLATMLASQPDVVQQRGAVTSAALRLLAARGADWFVSALDPSATGAAPPAEAGRLGDSLSKQRAYLKQVVQQSTHSLARFFLEVDAGYKQLETASRLRETAKQRLEAQRAFFEEKQVTIDRYLDAVSQYAGALAQEAQFKATYNIAIAALEEAKGTLLAHDNIAVVAGPSSKAKAPGGAGPWVAVRDRPAVPRMIVDPAVKAAGMEAPRADLGDGPDAECCESEGRKATPAPTTLKFDITIGAEKPVQVRGSITIYQGGASPAGPAAAPAHP